jgi:outer membrane receptor protein involved in Fe transport
MQPPVSRLLVLLVTLWGVPATVLGQATTGSISGRVLSSDRQPLPGVTIETTSPMLQGVRTAVTSDSGDYLIPLLPPGTYTIAFDLAGFQTVRRTQHVASTHNAPVDVTMSVAAVNEAVTVVADVRPLGQTAQVATNFKQELMATLPSNRTIDAVLLMSPSVHATGPKGAFSIDGALSYENLYLLNGGVINENLRGSGYPLYIEDALQEVTVATAGVSAEYGRFSGGLVTAITKSGGNAFSGSLRTSFANDFWRSKTPAASDPKRGVDPKNPGTIPTYEATLGGPVLKERLWFFGATRIRQEETARSTAFTGISYIRTNDEKRYEGKLTFAPRPNHSLQASYTAIDQVQSNFTSQVVLDTASLGVQNQPSDLLSVRYSGVVSPNLSLELQYSSRHLSINTGSTTRDRIQGTLLIDGSKNARYWSPTFCSVCGDEKRDNDDVFGKVSYFLPTRAFGAHHLTAGYDRFNDKIFQNAYASGSDFRILGTSSIIVGTNVFPQFLPNSTLIMHTPVEQSTLGSDLRMHSVFFNDGWRLNNRLSFNLGVRWDKNQAQDGGGAVVANKGLWSPRVAVIWDPRGDGRWAINASLARYVMPMTSNVAASTTAAGNASTLVWLYQGPAINADQNAPALVTSAAAIERVFQWFDDNGPRRKMVGSFLPGFNVRIDSPLKSPNADEYAVGTSRQLGTRGTLRVDGVWRTYHDFYSQRADMTTRSISDTLGNEYDLFFVENTNDVTRRYSGMSVQASYRVSGGLDVGGNYTLSRTWGNFDGETAGGGPSVAQVSAYPEYKRADWNSPEGDLAADQRHRANVWGTYVVPMPPGAGSITFGLLQQVGSGVPYGAVAPLSASSFGVQNPGYVSPAAPTGTIDYYFTARDAFRTATTYRTDLSVNYGRRLHAGGAQPELFFHGEVLNVFRDFQLCGCGGSAFSNGGSVDISTLRTSVRTPRTTPAGTYQTFNPFTTVPVRGIHWDLSTAPGSEFGGAVSHLAYTTPRLFRFSVGIRF